MGGGKEERADENQESLELTKRNVYVLLHTLQLIVFWGYIRALADLGLNSLSHEGHPIHS